ncbi:MAG: 50S ribosomal protein L11 methyltransferase [Desulfovibrionaceae bacterium]
MNTLIKIDIMATEDQVERVTGMLALHVPFGWQEQSLATGETRFSVHCDNAVFVDSLVTTLQARIPHLLIEKTAVANQDWTKAWREFFTPVACGKRFLVLPPWLRETTPLEGRTPIIIEPKSAFGTGHHATTALCLRVISDLLDSQRLQAGMEFLDLGTGSGILGIGCCLHGLHGVGTDIDLLAVENAQENVALNTVQTFEILLGSTEAVHDRTFDLLVANILAAPLKELAPHIHALLRPKACLVLSGILEVQAQGVEDAYTALGLPPAYRIIDGDWAVLVWKEV